jgi:hypothetical protein
MTCSIEGCDGRHEARGLCKRHYRRWQRAIQPEVEAEHDRKRRQTEAYRALGRERDLRRKHKRAAHNAVNNAIQAGRIARGDCSECGAPHAEGHHPDYSKPLEVVWLCRRCHTDLHRDGGRVEIHVA